MRRLTKKLHRIALRKGEKAKEELAEAYEKLTRLTRSSLGQAKRLGEVLRGGGTDQRAQEEVRSGALPLPRRGRDGTMGGLGDSSA